MYSISAQFCVRWQILEVSQCVCVFPEDYDAMNDTMIDRSTHLQGLLWNHKILPCMVKKFGKILAELYCKSSISLISWE